MAAKYLSAIQASASKYQLSDRLLAAIIFQESGGYPFAVRYEPGFATKYLQGKTPEQLGGYWPRMISKQTEYVLRASSIGLTQVMGQVARESGFAGDSLLELVDPGTNIELCAKIVRGHLDRTKDLRKALLRYNGGGYSEYPDDVIQLMESQEIDFLLG